MTTGNRWEGAFRQLLARKTGRWAASPVIAAAARHQCERFARQVTPLIGAGGIAAIYARSLNLIQRQFPSPAPVLSSDPGDSPVARVQSFLEAQDQAVATEAAVAVLTTVGELLASFIGESLTTRLLREAWPDDFAGHHPEETPQ
jgi:hypothetical protein